MKERALADRLFRAALCWSMTAFAAAALFLPALGPLLDHHYAERQPNHAHVYLGPAAPDHVHPFEMYGHHVHHSHDHAPSSDGIVYLVSHDGTSPAQVDVTIPSVEGSSFTVPEEKRTSFGTARNDSLPNDALIAPPKQPPRA